MAKSLFDRDQFEATVSGSLAHITSSRTRLMAMRVNLSLTFVSSGSLPTTFRKEQRLHSNGTPIRWSPPLPHRSQFYLYAASTSRSDPLCMWSSMGKLLSGDSL